MTKVIDTLTQDDFHGTFQKLLERYNKCIAAGGDYFERGLKFHVCPINKRLETYLMILVLMGKIRTINHTSDSFNSISTILL